MDKFDFKRRFGQKILFDEVEKDFINKINLFLFRLFNKQKYYNYPKLFEFICLQLSLNPDDVLKEYNRSPLYGTLSYETKYPGIRYFTQDRFEETLLLIEIIYSYFFIIAKSEYRSDEYLAKIEETVHLAMRQPISIGVVWKNGKFYPEGAKELEEKLVDDAFKWLGSYSKAKNLYRNAWDNYSQSLRNTIKRRDVISNAFQAVEELTRVFLRNKKPFDKNFNQLIDNLKLADYWKQIFYNYKELSKEYGRHPGRGKEFIPTQEETEGFLYLSGIILRLILEKLKKNDG